MKQSVLGCSGIDLRFSRSNSSCCAGWLYVDGTGMYIPTSSTGDC